MDRVHGVCLVPTARAHERSRMTAYDRKCLRSLRCWDFFSVSLGALHGGFARQAWGIVEDVFAKSVVTCTSPSVRLRIHGGSSGCAGPWIREGGVGNPAY